MAIDRGNIWAAIPAQIPAELTEMLAGSQTVKIERIISRGHRSADGFWYDQDQNEWVLLLKGQAGLSFEGQAATVELTAGDYLNIPAHVRHRVAWTAGDTETIWLAVKY
jgi:cupin 2 domain-containing protein